MVGEFEKEGENGNRQTAEKKKKKTIECGKT
jgi:hypothetical protein